MADPKISVVMPVWNGERYLREAIESILNQSFRDFEFIILDDGSTDITPEILVEYASKDSRIRVISLNHEGIVTALNRGIIEARALWIARMDCDDIAHLERFEQQWKAIQKHPDAILCHTQIHMIGESQYLTKTPRFIGSEALLKLRLCLQCPIVHPTVMFHKDAFHAVGGYLPEERHAEDYALWGRMIEQGKIIGIPTSLLDFRVHSNSISRKKLEIQSQLSRQISILHCQKFMQLNRDEAERALNTLGNTDNSSTISDWFWLLSHCLPRLKEQGLELWLWVFKHTFRRLFCRD